MESIGEHIGQPGSGNGATRPNSLAQRLQRIREAAARRQSRAPQRPSLWDEDEEEHEAPVPEEEESPRAAPFSFDEELHPRPSLRPRAVEE